MCARFWRKKQKDIHPHEPLNGSGPSGSTASETPIRYMEKGEVVLWYPKTNTEVRIPGASLAAGMETDRWREVKHYVFKSCDEDHKAFDLWNGKLFGLSGKQHEKNLTDVNVWLTDTYIPETMFTVGIKSEDEKVAHILYPIDDMGAPSNDDRFRELLVLLKARLMAGQTVTVSCFGGHGRTGLVMACLVGNSGIRQAITHIRANGCEKWVESKSQVDYVSHIVGEKQEVKPAKGDWNHGSQTQGGSLDWPRDRDWPDRYNTKGFTGHF